MGCVVKFIGREEELSLIKRVTTSNEATILVVYGRRRVGKMELIEQALGKRHLIKLEGVEDGDKATQMYRVLYQLSKAFKDPNITRMQFNTWMELLDFIAGRVSKGKWTLYFEELQWLAEYKSELIADLKYVWDNAFRHNPELLVVLCGSSPSFMINEVIHSKALYNRPMNEIHLKEFSLSETISYLPKRAPRDVMDAYLTIGGIPEYLKRISKHSSLFLGIAEESFKTNGYFTKEKKRIFVSSFASSIHYEAIINFLSHVKFATKKEIETHLGVQGGGNLTAVLIDLELCGFIEKYRPYQAEEGSHLIRYTIQDNFLRFYFKFIAPIASRIERGDYSTAPAQALNRETYQKWLGFAFERFCSRRRHQIASLLGFSAVQYQSGPFFNRSTSPGFQIDLLFYRADRVLTVTEIKYTEGKTGTEVIEEFESKLRLLPVPKGAIIEKVLISATGASDPLIHRGYFDRILTLEDFTLSSRKN